MVEATMSFLKKPSKCPNCDTKLDKAPTRKRKCPDCGKYIYVRKGNLYSEDGVTKFDWLEGPALYYDDFSSEDFDRHHKLLSDQFGFNAPVRDVIWRIYNSLFREAAQTSNLRLMSHVYRDMAKFVLEEGKDTKDLVQDANKFLLLDAQQTANLGFELDVELFTANDSHICDWCRNVAQRKWSIEELLEKMPLPGDCTSKICRCHISFLMT